MPNTLFIVIGVLVAGILLGYLLKTTASPSSSSNSSDATLLNKYNINGDNHNNISTATASGSKADWINDRKQREAHMKAQRQQMVLNARRRTLELMTQQQQTKASM